VCTFSGSAAAAAAAVFIFSVTHITYVTLHYSTLHTPTYVT